jgi:hypothetical protein
MGKTYIPQLLMFSILVGPVYMAFPYGIHVYYENGTGIRPVREEKK